MFSIKNGPTKNVVLKTFFLKLTPEIGTGGKHFSKTEEDANRPIGYFCANVVVLILSKFHQLVGSLLMLFKG